MRQRASGKGISDLVHFLANDEARQGLQIQEGLGQELRRFMERTGKKEVREECTLSGVMSVINCV